MPLSCATKPQAVAVRPPFCSAAPSPPSFSPSPGCASAPVATPIVHPFSTYSVAPLRAVAPLSPEPVTNIGHRSQPLTAKGIEISPRLRILTMEFTVFTATKLGL